MTALLLILVFLLFQTFVLLCCVAAGNDAASQESPIRNKWNLSGNGKNTLQQPSKIKGCCNVLINLLHHITVISYCFSF